MRVFFISTSHLSRQLWFLDEDDFKVAMNLVAVVAAKYRIRVLAFVLMSNHVHFILYCDPETARAFIENFKQKYSLYFQHKYKNRHKGLLHDNTVDIQEVLPENESIERAIAYVQMNPVASRICQHPSVYPWGTGNTFFNAFPDSGRPLGSLSRRAQIRLVHSNDELPADYKVGERGFILPSSYVPTERVEALFRTPTRYQYFLTSSSKARAYVESSEPALPSFLDQSLIAGMKDLCRSLFQCNSPQDLSEEQARDLVKQLKYRFSADVNQLARVTGWTYEKVCTLLDTL
ncbi:MAG: transposase [Bacteroidales bacterium]|nr:transposase [Bacteroidales bacterium]